jgi:hypothetical protein
VELIFSAISVGKQMRGYRYSFSNEQGAIEASLILHSEGDEAACDLASELLSRSESFFVEVRRGPWLIFQIRRDASNGDRLDLAQSVGVA